MKKIPLSKGKFALVDDEDYGWLSQRSWCVREVRRKRLPPQWYPIHSSRSHYHIYMHTEIAKRYKLPSGVTDHKDGNGLNNQKSNLRRCSDSQNGGNASKTSGRSSKYKGVTWVKRTNKWLSRIMCEGIYHYLGEFVRESDAAKAYDKAAKIYFGEFARLNNP